MVTCDVIVPCHGHAGGYRDLHVKGTRYSKKEYVSLYTSMPETCHVMCMYSVSMPCPGHAGGNKKPALKGS